MALGIRKRRKEKRNSIQKIGKKKKEREWKAHNETVEIHQRKKSKDKA